MKVAQLIETLDPGGAEALAVGIANELAGRGLDSHLLVVDGAGRFRERVASNVHLHDLERPRDAGALPSRARYFARTWRVIDGIVRANGIDVVQTHLPKANFFGLALAALRRIRVHPTVHNNKEFEYGDRPSRWKERARRDAYRLMLRVNAEMIAVSAEVKAAMAAELGVAGTARERGIVAVPNGVTAPEPLTAADRAAARREWGVSGDDVLLMSAGRLTGQKNYASLVEVLARLDDSRGGWKCVIAGEGEQRDELSRRIAEHGLQDRVLLPGHVSEVRRLMAASDVFCMSSIYEGLPLVMLEAMAAGLPVCAFGIRGTADVVTSGREGLLVEPGDEAAFADALHRLMSDRSLAAELGGNGRNLVLERYSFAAMVDSLLALYGRGASGTRGEEHR